MKETPCVLPKQWLWATLADLGVVSGGLTKNAGRAAQGNRLPYLRVANVYANRLSLDDIQLINASDTEVRRTTLQKGDLLVIEGNGSIDQIGRVALWNGAIEPCVHQNHIIKVRFAVPDVGRFMLYWLLSPDGRREVVRVASSTSGLHTLSLSKVGSLPVCLAPIEEQQRITAALDSYLSRLDETTTLLDRVQHNLKRYRASVLKAAVEGRLVPTEAELARAEKRDYEPASTLLKRILTERRQRWEKEGRRGKYEEPEPPDPKSLPELPEGWCWATWSQIGFSQNGRAFPSSKYSNKGIRLLRPGNLHASGRVIWTAENTRHLPARFATENADLIVNAGELVMNLTAQSLKDEFLGRICITSDSVCLLNQRLARLTPVLADTKYILWMFKSPHFRRFVDSLNKGSLIQHMFTSQLAGFVVPLPSLEEQRRIAAEVERRLSIADDIERTALHNLERQPSLRQAILKWAFEGKIVDQDPNDEPASALLARIKAEQPTTTAKAAPRRRAKTA